MLDKNLNPYRDDIAAESLKGIVSAPQYITPKKYQIICGGTPIKANNNDNAENLSEALFGETFDVYEIKNGYAWGQSNYDNYVGYIKTDSISDVINKPTHKICVLRTYIFAEPKVQANILHTLSLGALINPSDKIENNYVYCDGFGWIYYDHICEINEFKEDASLIAKMFLGAPYTWGGRQSLGVDCSGLVQTSFAACGIFLNRDAYMQEEEGELIEYGQQKKNDLIFWKGHVAIMIDDENIIHANANHMMTAIEPLIDAKIRIESKGLPIRTIRRNHKI